jgi:hypothetical protein
MIAAAAAIALATVLAGCTTGTPEKTTICTPEQVIGQGASFGTATTTALPEKVAFPLNFVLENRTDVACTATAVIHFSDGKSADRTIQVALLSTAIATARQQIDKVVLQHDGARATDSGTGALSWKVQGKPVLGATPYKTKNTLVEVLG